MYQAPGIPDISEASKLEALERIKEIIEVREGVRGSSADDALMTIARLAIQVIRCQSVHPADGISGYFDDGTNFRVTLTNGVVTGIAASSGGGYAIT